VFGHPLYSIILSKDSYTFTAAYNFVVA